MTAHRALLEAAVSSIAAGKPFSEVVGDVLRLAAEEAPSDAWDALAALDTAADVATATPWLQRQFDNRPMAAEVNGIWFGIFIVRGAGPGRNEAFIGLSGDVGYPDTTWPSEAKPAWETAGFPPAPGLRSLLPSTAGESDEVRALVAGPVVFAWALGLVAAMADGVDAAAALGDRPVLGVVAGVPGGATAVLGELTAAGFDRSAARLELEPEPEAEPEEPGD
ncbi:MAG TPA: hypothetical protein VFJ85_12730 [Acidimicrobiales bacterium]|nr:hypothetical protein [Acidimicrobiales bacterium]